MSSSPKPIIIDVSNVFDINISKQIKEALSTTGYFYGINHGIDQESDALLKALKQFYNLPVDEKLKVHQDKHGKYRGYHGYGQGQPNFLTKPDNKEGYYIFSEELGKDISPEHHEVFGGKNVWPSEEVLPDFRRTVESYWEAVVRFSNTFMSGLACGLGKICFIVVIIVNCNNKVFVIRAS